MGGPYYSKRLGEVGTIEPLGILVKVLSCWEGNAVAYHPASIIKKVNAGFKLSHPTPVNIVAGGPLLFYGAALRIVGGPLRIGRGLLKRGVQLGGRES